MTRFQKIRLIIKLLSNQINNQYLLQLLSSGAYAPQKIRHALIILNAIRLSTLANGISTVTLYEVLRGESKNSKAMEIISAALGVDKELLFCDLLK